MDEKRLDEMRKLADGQEEPAKGLGDVVAKVTKAVGIKPCGGCKKRQEWLNRKVPFNRSK